MMVLSWLFPHLASPQTAMVAPYARDNLTNGVNGRANVSWRTGGRGL